MDNGYVVSSGQSFAPERRRLWKRIIIIIVVILLIIIVGVSAFLIIKNNREKRQTLAENFYNSIGWVGFSKQCPTLIDYVNDDNIPSDEYDVFVESCLDEGTTIQSFISQFASFNSSQEYGELYSNLSTAISKTVVLGEDLERAVNIFQTWHNWIVALKDIKNYQTPEDIEKFAKKLTQSDSDVFEAYVEQWTESREKFVETYMTVSVLPSDQRALNEYERAKSSYQEALDNAPDLVALTGLGRETSDDNISREAVIQYVSYLKENL